MRRSVIVQLDQATLDRYLSRRGTRSGHGAGFRELVDSASGWSLRHGCPGPCHRWLGRTNRNGYGRARVTAQLELRAHRVAYLLEYGLDALPPGALVIRICRRADCVNPRHMVAGDAADLVLVAPGEPVDPAFDEQVSRQASRRSRPRLNVTQVRQLRALWASGDLTQRELASRYGLAQSAVSRVCAGKSYAGVA